jgi:hypothetical protein
MAYYIFGGPLQRLALVGKIGISPKVQGTTSLPSSLLSDLFQYYYHTTKKLTGNARINISTKGCYTHSILSLRTHQGPRKVLSHYGATASQPTELAG